MLDKKIKRLIRANHSTIILPVYQAVEKKSNVPMNF